MAPSHDFWNNPYSGFLDLVPFMKWLTRNTALVPFEMRAEDVKVVLESAKTRDVIERELK